MGQNKKGQDIAAGTRAGFRLAAERARSTTQVKLRLRPEDALRLRALASESRAGVSTYVARLLDDPTRAVPARIASAPSELSLADVSRLAGVIALLPQELRRSRGELGNACGLVKHLFDMPATAGRAEQHAYALAETVRVAYEAIANVDVAVARLLDGFAGIREDLATTARQLASRT